MVSKGLSALEFQQLSSLNVQQSTQAHQISLGMNIEGN